MKYYNNMNLFEKMVHKFSKPCIFISPRWFNIRYENFDRDQRLLTITICKVAIQFIGWHFKERPYFKWELFKSKYAQI